MVNPLYEQIKSEFSVGNWLLCRGRSSPIVAETDNLPTNMVNLDMLYPTDIKPKSELEVNIGGDLRNSFTD